MAAIKRRIILLLPLLATEESPPLGFLHRWRLHVRPVPTSSQLHREWQSLGFIRLELQAARHFPALSLFVSHFVWWSGSPDATDMLIDLPSTSGTSESSEEPRLTRLHCEENSVALKGRGRGNFLNTLVVKCVNEPFCRWTCVGFRNKEKWELSKRLTSANKKGFPILNDFNSLGVARLPFQITSKSLTGRCFRYPSVTLVEEASFQLQSLS